MGGEKITDEVDRCGITGRAPTCGAGRVGELVSAWDGIQVTFKHSINQLRSRQNRPELRVLETESCPPLVQSGNHVGAATRRTQRNYSPTRG